MAASEGEYPVQKLILRSIDKMDRSLDDLHKVLRDLEREIIQARSDIKGLREDYKRLDSARNEASSKMMMLEKVDREARGSLLDRLTKLEANQRRTLGVGAGVGAGAGAGLWTAIEVVKALMAT